MLVYIHGVTKLVKMWNSMFVLWKGVNHTVIDIGGRASDGG